MYNMSKEKKLKILTFTVMAILVSLIISIGISQSILNKTKDNLIDNIEMQWRDEAKDKSIYLAQQLELSIAKGEVNYWDDTELHQWVLEHMLPMKVGGDNSNVIVANIGYSTRKWDETLWNTVKESNKLKVDANLDKKINEYFNSIEILNKSNIEINSLIGRVGNYIATKHSVDKNNLITSMRQVLFIKNKVLLDTEPTSIINNKFINSKSLEDYLKKDSTNYAVNYERVTSGNDSSHHQQSILDTEKTVKMIEWSVVPPNKLGWELEPPHLSGVYNVSYKKIAIIIEIDKNEIYSLYKSDLTRIDKYIYISTIVMALIVIVVLLSLLFNFYKFLSNDK